MVGIPHPRTVQMMIKQIKEEEADKKRETETQHQRRDTIEEKAGSEEGQEDG